MANKKHILIVDDDHDIRRVTHFRLRSAGYETLQAENGRQGVDAAEANRPDAIVMDIRMPVMDGSEALKQLQSSESTRDIPVIIMSASPCEEATCRDQGARFFIRKPYSVNALLAAVDAVTNDSRKPVVECQAAAVS